MAKKKQTRPWAQMAEIAEGVIRDAWGTYYDATHHRHVIAELAEDIAREKWKSLEAGKKADREKHLRNLLHLEVQWHGRLAELRVRLGRTAQEVFFGILRAVVAGLVSGLIGKK